MLSQASEPQAIAGGGLGDAGAAPWVARLDRFLGHLIEIPVALLVLAEVVILFSGIFARYVLNTPLIWSDELASLLFLWLAMLGAAVAFRRGEHMRMTALVSKASPRTRAFLEVFAVTAALAFLVFFTVLIYGFYKNGLKFLKLFVPSGIPIAILRLVVFIEVFSFFLRPISHSVRLFANMLAGHIALAVFAGFIPMLAGLGIAGYFGAVLPLGMVIALGALEILVAFLQAYVFTILTVIYLNDAIHPGH